MHSVPQEVYPGLAEMNNGQSGASGRKLVYIPIIHTLADMGTLGAAVRGMKLSALGRQGLSQNAAVVDKMWARIESVVAKLPVAPGSLRVYQDGLPVCRHEQEIVSELASAGNRNHGLLLKLQARGATLMGTESPELLVEEYQLAAAAFASGAAARTEVRQQHVGVSRADQLQRLDSVFGQQRGEPRAVQEAPQQLGHLGLVLGNQDSALNRTHERRPWLTRGGPSGQITPISESRYRAT